MKRKGTPVKARVLTALTTILMLLLGGCGNPPAAAPSSPPTREPASATIGLTYIPNVQFAPFYVADQRGYFAEAGVQATLRHHGANEGLFTALASGQEHFVVAGGDELVQARSQGLDLVAIAAYYRRYPIVLIVPAGSSIATAADLKGRSVGVPGRYGESWFGLQVLLNSAGLAESDVRITEIGYTQQAALTAGKVDALMGFSNNERVQFERAGVPTRTISLTPSGDVPLVSISLITTRAYLDAHPTTATAVADAMVRGIRTAVDDPDAALHATAKEVPSLGDDASDKEAAAATLTATAALWTDASGQVSGKLDPSRWAAMTAFMKAQGLIATDVDPDQAMTNAHVSR